MKKGEAWLEAWVGARACAMRLTHGIWLRLLASVGLVVLLLGSVGGPQPGPGVVRVGSWPGFGRGPAADIAVAGHYLFVPIEQGGLRVLDATDPSHPVLAASVPLEGIASFVKVSGTRAYVAGKVARHGGGCEAQRWRGRVSVLDISDPARPALQGTYTTKAEILSLCVAGNIVYACDSGEGLHIVDMSDPARPEQLSVGSPPDCSSASALCVSGSRLYSVANYQWCVVDVTQPASPVLVTNMPSAGQETSSILRHIAARDGLVFVAEGDFGYSGNPDAGRLAIYGPGVGGEFVLRGKLELTNAALNVSLEGTVAYVAMGDAGVITVDISNPASPKEIGRCDTPGLSLAVSVQETNLYVADYFNGVQVMQVGESNRLSMVGGIDTGLSARKLRVAGNRVYLLSSDSHPTLLTQYESRSRLEVLIVKNSAEPELLARYDLPAVIMDLDVSSNLVCLGYNRFDRTSSEFQEQRMQLLDFSDPTHPVCLSDTRVGSSPANLALRLFEGKVLVSSGSETGLQVFDLQNPAAPVLLARTNGFAPYEEVRVVGGLAYLGHDSGLGACRIDKPQAPEPLVGTDFGYSSNDDCDS